MDWRHYVGNRGWKFLNVPVTRRLFAHSRSFRDYLSWLDFHSILDRIDRILATDMGVPDDRGVRVINFDHARLR